MMGKLVKPGRKWCPNCRQQLYRTQDESGENRFECYNRSCGKVFAVAKKAATDVKDVVVPPWFCVECGTKLTTANCPTCTGKSMCIECKTTPLEKPDGDIAPCPHCESKMCVACCEKMNRQPHYGGRVEVVSMCGKFMDGPVEKECTLPRNHDGRHMPYYVEQSVMPTGGAFGPGMAEFGAELVAAIEKQEQKTEPLMHEWEEASARIRRLFS